MSLVSCSNLSPAAWVVTSDVPWERLVVLGPAGFAAYARLRFLPDPAYDGQRENDLHGNYTGREEERLQVLFEVLAAHTRTPGECYFCLWDGWGDEYSSGDATAHERSAGGRPRLPLQGPKVTVPHDASLPYRAYFLFQGPLSDAGDWNAAAEMWPEAAFVWPADHAWCMACDVDPHWAGIGAATEAIDQLVNDPRLDVVPADPDEEQPFYQ